MPTFQENLWDAIHKWMDGLESERADSLSRGAVEDWAHYQHDVGYLQAIRDTRETILAIETKLQRG